MDLQTQYIRAGKTRLVVMPESEFNTLLQRAGMARQEDDESDLLPLPPMDAEGLRPAVATARALMARDIQRSRKALGMTQADLAKAAGVRVETISRLEGGKQSVTEATIAKIDKALASGRVRLRTRRRR